MQSFYMSGKGIVILTRRYTFRPNSIVNIPNIMKLLRFSFLVATCIIIKQREITRIEFTHSYMYRNQRYSHSMNNINSIEYRKCIYIKNLKIFTKEKIQKKNANFSAVFQFLKKNNCLFYCEKSFKKWEKQKTKRHRLISQQKIYMGELKLNHMKNIKHNKIHHWVRKMLDFVMNR